MKPLTAATAPRRYVALAEFADELIPGRVLSLGETPESRARQAYLQELADEVARIDTRANALKHEEHSAELTMKKDRRRRRRPH